MDTDTNVTDATIPEAEWDSPMFNLAQQQFLGAADLMGLDQNLKKRLLFLQRTQIASSHFLIHFTIHAAYCHASLLCNATTSPTIISVGALTSFSSMIAGRDCRVPTNTFWSGVVPC